MPNTSHTTVTVPEDLSYIEEYQILVCLTCKTVICPGDSSERHFRDVHQLKGQPLRDALQYISTLLLQDPQTVDLPPNGSSVVPELGPPIRGFQCLSCDFLSRSRKKVTVHVRSAKHWKSPESWVGVALQTFSRGSYARYWRVAVGGPDVAVEGQTEEENHAGDQRADVPDSFRQMLSKYQVEFDAKRVKRRQLADNPREVKNVLTWVCEIG